VFNAPTNGTYVFNMATADDYGMIFIDGVRVAMGGNGTGSGSFYLSAGAHSIVVYNANNAGAYGIAVDVMGPGIALQRLTNSLLSGAAAIGSLSGDASSTLILSNTVLFISQTNNGVFAGVITDNGTGSGSINKGGTNTLTLTGNNTYTGGTILGAGRLAISGSTNIGGDNTAITFAGGLLQINGTDINALTNHMVNWTTFNGGFDIAVTSHTFYVTNVISGAGQFTKLGAGALVLSATNTYSGGTVVGGSGMFVFNTLSNLGGATANIIITNGNGAPTLAPTFVPDQSVVSAIASTTNTFVLALPANSANNYNFAGLPGGSLGASNGIVANYTGLLTGATNNFNLGGGEIGRAHV
jgi:autotransporter-associated beta strand protein